MNPAGHGGFASSSTSRGRAAPHLLEELRRRREALRGTPRHRPRLAAPDRQRRVVATSYGTPSASQGSRARPEASRAQPRGSRGRARAGRSSTAPFARRIGDSYVSTICCSSVGARPRRRARRRPLRRQRRSGGAGRSKSVGAAVAQAPGDDGQGRVGTTLSESQHCCLATRSAARALRAAEGVLSTVELTQSSTDVADLRPCGSTVGHVAAGELLARQLRLELRLGSATRVASARRRGARDTCRGRSRTGVAAPTALWPRSTPPRGRESPSSSHALIRLQYTLPVEYGPSRPSTANSIASSRWPMPCELPHVDEHPTLGLQCLGFEVSRPQPSAQRDRVGGESHCSVEVAAAVSGLRLAAAGRSVFDAVRIGLEARDGRDAAGRGDRWAAAHEVVLVEPHCALPGPPVITAFVVQVVARSSCGDAVRPGARATKRLRPSGQRAWPRARSV